MASTDSHGLTTDPGVSMPLVKWAVGRVGLKDWFGANEVAAMEVPSHCHREPSSEQENRWFGFCGWNLTSHTVEIH